MSRAICSESVAMESLEPSTYGFQEMHKPLKYQKHTRLVPRHRDFPDLEAEAQREEQELDVKGPALNVQRSERRLRRRTTEQLEAALRVSDAAHAADDADGQVKGDHERVPQRRPRRDGVRRDEMRARAADDDGLQTAPLVVAGRRARLALEPFDVCDARGAVGVDDEDPVAARPKGAFAHGAALAAVAAQRGHAETRGRRIIAEERGAERGCHRRRAVRAAVVDDEHLKGKLRVGRAAREEIFCGRSQHLRQPVALVVRGDDERKVTPARDAAGEPRVAVRLIARRSAAPRGGGPERHRRPAQRQHQQRQCKRGQPKQGHGLQHRRP
mmetsp:Transcript_13467/g.47155  ORF Transcript_13467/g.47155 Transcript_13467/m.47155 type:complete len:328 (-) Transcript_13467:10-993(-)